MSTASKKEIQGDWMVPLRRIKLIYWFESDGQSLRELRESRKLSLRDMAAKMGDIGYSSNYNSLYKLESGKAQSTSPEMIMAIADVLDVHIGRIIPSLFVGIDVGPVQEEKVNKT